jgi:hypothetical protein
MPIHDIKMNPVSTSLIDRFDLVAQPAEVRRQN